jgi:hypothetical protein
MATRLRYSIVDEKTEVVAYNSRGAAEMTNDQRDSPTQ